MSRATECNPGPDAAASQGLYRWRAGIYDLQLAPYDAIRAEAIASLQLLPGQTVLDLGCGTGMSLALLQAAVGPQGQVLAVDQCPEMVEEARRRVQRHGWQNVSVACAPIDQAILPSGADAALFHFTHDILQTPAAVDHVLAHLRPGARLAATGLQWAPAGWGVFNGLVWLAAVHSVTTLHGLDQPWRPLADRGVELTLRTHLGNTVYVASGSVPASAAPQRGRHNRG